MPHYRLEHPKTPAYIILHYGHFKSGWDWFILLLTIYTAVMVPFNLTFHRKDDRITGWDSFIFVFMILDSIVDLIFFIDIILNFHTTYVGKSGEVISDSMLICTLYLRGWLIVDVLSCIPYEAISGLEAYMKQGQHVALVCQIFPKFNYFLDMKIYFVSIK